MAGLMGTVPEGVVQSSRITELAGDDPSMNVSVCPGCARDGPEMAAAGPDGVGVAVADGVGVGVGLEGVVAVGAASVGSFSGVGVRAGVDVAGAVLMDVGAAASVGLAVAATAAAPVRVAVARAFGGAWPAGLPGPADRVPAVAATAVGVAAAAGTPVSAGAAANVAPSPESPRPKKRLAASIATPPKMSAPPTAVSTGRAERATGVGGGR